MNPLRWRRRHTVTAAAPRKARPAVEPLEDRLVPSISVGTNFNGLNINDSTYRVEPPDPIVAAGPNQVVELVNTAIRISDKSGKTLFTQDLSDFFAPLHPEALGDPMVMFDDSVSNGSGAPAGRFIVGITDFNFYGRSYFDFAVSRDADPSDGFGEVHQVDMSAGGHFLLDFPRAGFNADAYVISFNMFSPAGSQFDHVELLSIDKSTVIDNNPTFTSYQVASPNKSDFTLVPAVMHGAAAGGAMYFVEEATYNGGDTVNVVTMTNVLSEQPTFTTTPIAVTSYTAPPNAAQPGGYFMRTNDSRILNAAWRDDELVAAQTVGSGSVAQARWYQFSTAGNAPTLVDSGQIDGGPGVSTYYPAVEIDANMDIGMVYMQSSASEYVSVYVTGRTPSDAAGTMQKPVEVAAGSDTYTANRAGDYSGISVDPSTGTSFWVASEYVPDQRVADWGTEVANFAVT
jgi:hypothetical protein